MWLSSGCKLPPLNQGILAIDFEGFATVEMAVLIEVVMDRSMDRSEFLK